jgi:hypothetical protein
VGRHKTHGINNTPLTEAIRSMRRRIRLGQVEFTVLILGKFTAGIVSRWESGQMMPGIENLLRLLAFATTPGERTPIVEAIKAQGIDSFRENLAKIGNLLSAADPYLARVGDATSTSPKDSIAPTSKAGNA